MRTPRLLTLAAAGVVACGAAACSNAGSGNAGGADGGAGAVNATDTSCAVARTELPAGTSVFAVTNHGQQVTEFYVYGPGDRVMGEVENIAPGLTRQVRVELAAGSYQAA